MYHRAAVTTQIDHIDTTARGTKGFAAEVIYNRMIRCLG